MPLLFGKVFVAIAVTAVAAGIALTLGTIMALVEEADQRGKHDSKTAA